MKISYLIPTLNTHLIGLLMYHLTIYYTEVGGVYGGGRSGGGDEKGRRRMSKR